MLWLEYEEREQEMVEEHNLECENIRGAMLDQTKGLPIPAFNLHSS